MDIYTLLMSFLMFSIYLLYFLHPPQNLSPPLPFSPSLYLFLSPSLPLLHTHHTPQQKSKTKQNKIVPKQQKTFLKHFKGFG